MPPRDPLGVLTSTLPVVESASLVGIDINAVERVAQTLADQSDADPGWTDDLHFRDGTWRTAGWVLALDALNFCFWSTNSDPTRRWRVAYDGQLLDGYWALVAALRKAVDDGSPVWDADWLATVSDTEVHALLAPAVGEEEIPLLAARVAHLRELGKGLQALGEEIGSANPVEALLERADHSAVHLVEEVTRRFPSFDDVVQTETGQIRFYKRAQILAADLHGAFAGDGLGRFDDLEQLTAFADYKVPQVLRRLGVLVYADLLAEQIDEKALIAQQSRTEIEIRASTIWAVELIRQALAKIGRTLCAFEIDWLLWQAGQRSDLTDHPYHRTLTPYY